MHYISTRGNASNLDFRGVTLAGLASDGGLYVLERALRRRGFAVVATIALLLLGNGFVTAIQGISREEGHARVGEVAGLGQLGQRPSLAVHRKRRGQAVAARTPSPGRATGALA